MAISQAIRTMLSCALISLARKTAMVSAFTESFSFSYARAPPRRSLVGTTNTMWTAVYASDAPRPSRSTPTKLTYQVSSTDDTDFSTDAESTPSGSRLRVDVLTLPLPELEALVVAWGHKKFRAAQIQDWIREKGVTDFDEMVNIPKPLRRTLYENARVGSLDLAIQEESKDGTIKRAYRLHDGQLIESVLMPYDDGRNTACISSQAGCAMGCVFCATGQMGFARQLTPDEIFEQVARFDSELKGNGERLSNVVMMGMGEPLANYRNVMTAIRRMNDELGIGARKITVSTVGVVPSINKLAEENLQIRLAISLHCASEEERSALLPANLRYGGIDELLSSVREYIEKTRRRVTFEWALIEGQNDDPSTARQLGRLLKRHGIRRDMAHINVIPLNPTGGFAGGPSGRKSVEKFCSTLDSEFGISATPRMRRGIDIDAGCGQLKAVIERREKKGTFPTTVDKDELGISSATPRSRFDDTSGAETDLNKDADDVYDPEAEDKALLEDELTLVDFMIHENALDLDLDEIEDEVVDENFDPADANRLIALVQTSFLKPEHAAATEVTDKQSRGTAEERGSADKSPSSTPQVETRPTTTISDEEDVRRARRKRKKLLKSLKAIAKLKDMESNGKALNEEQRAKVTKEKEWMAQIESIEHNLR